MEETILTYHTDHEREADTYPTYRETCRGIIVKDGSVLLSHEILNKLYLLPGGGIEDGETAEECCIRELSEEPGYNVKIQKHIADVYMYFDDGKFLNHFFECTIISHGQIHLLDYEEAFGMTPEWMEIKKALRMFEGYKSIKDNEAEKRILYQREYLALKSYVEQSQAINKNNER